MPNYNTTHHLTCHIDFYKLSGAFALLILSSLTPLI